MSKDKKNQDTQGKGVRVAKAEIKNISSKKRLEKKQNELRSSWKEEQAQKSA